MRVLFFSAPLLSFVSTVAFFCSRFVRTVSVYFSQLNNWQSNCSCYGFYRWDSLSSHSLSGFARRPWPIVLRPNAGVHALVLADTFCHSSHPTGDTKKNKMWTDEKLFTSKSRTFICAIANRARPNEKNDPQEAKNNEKQDASWTYAFAC